ncbi:hypothetical protein B1H25_14110 [Lactiplantibacillus plantarum]|nr:hypothetical protein B1H25_14110 [Lactiplantibacillus plantarum]
MPPVMFSVVTKYHKGRHSLFLYNSEIFYAFTQDILRSPKSISHPTISSPGYSEKSLVLLTYVSASKTFN